LVGDRRMLVVLDNLEQVAAAAPGVVAVLGACPNLRVLATSRVVLRVDGEHVVDVPPLGLPPSSDAPTPRALRAHGATRLFLDRATAARADFAATPANARSIVGVCSRLDGVPLAIELAAARVRTLTPEALAAALDHPLPLLRGGAADRPA